MADRRTARTKRAIQEAFLQLIQDKDLNQITVAELSQKADLGRGTFYLHYQDIYDLYDQMVGEVFQVLMESFDAAFPTASAENLRNLVETIVNFTEQYQDYIRLLSQPQKGGKAWRELKKLYYEKIAWESPAAPGSEYGSVEAVFIVSGVLGILEEWINKNLPVSKDELSPMLHKLLLKF